MAQVTLGSKVWQAFVAAAEQQGRNPKALAEALLRDYLKQMADEELDAATRQAFQRAKFRLKDTEAIIREHRQQRAARLKNGSTEKADAGGA